MTRHFILVFDRATGDLAVEEPAGDRSTALARLESLEHEHREDTSVEVVLIGSNSLESVRQTHPHYFNKERGSDSLAQIDEHVQ